MEQSRRRLAAIDPERGAIPQGAVKVHIGAGNMVPGQPVTEYRRLIIHKFQIGCDHLLVGTDHSLSIDNAFRHSGGTGCLLFKSLSSLLWDLPGIVL